MDNDNPGKQNLRKYFINTLIELLIYGILVTLYFFFVLRYLGTPLVVLFNQRLYFYAFISLALIVAQGVLLERITFYILYWIGIKRFD